MVLEEDKKQLVTEAVMSSLKQSIQASKGHMTRVVKAMDAFDPAIQKESEFKELLVRFGHRIDTWLSNQDRYEAIVTDSELDACIESANDYEVQVRSSYRAFEEKWLDAHPVVSPAPSTTSESSQVNNGPGSQVSNGPGSQVNGDAQQQPAAQQNGQSTVRLPKLELPKFSGDVLKYFAFWQSFADSIDSRENLSDVSKYNYLQSCLKGEAKTVIEGFSVTGENYAEVKTVLNNRYGRKELVIFAHVQAMLLLQCTSAPSDIVLFHDRLRSHIRSLASLGIQSSNYGVVLTPIVISRLPSEVREEWSRKSEGKEADLDYLMEFLQGEVRRRDRCDTMSIGEQKSTFSTKGTSQGGSGGFKGNGGRGSSQYYQSRSGRGRGIGSSASLAVSGRGGTYVGTSPVVAKCVLCDGSHSVLVCPTYVGMDQAGRKRVLFTHQLCFKCIASDHISVQCSHVCSVCGGGHHSSICLGPSRTDFGANRRGRGGRGRGSPTVRGRPALYISHVDHETGQFDSAPLGYESTRAP